MPEASSPLLDYLLTHEESFKSRARLASLYSDFRAQAQTNPDGYEANVTAWRRGLQDAAKAGLLPGGDLLVLRTGPKLLEQLQLERWGMPAALGVVVRDALAKGELMPLDGFLSQQHSIYSRNRITPWRVAGWVGTWALQQLGLMAREGTGDDKLAVGAFVIKANVEAAAAALMAQLQKEHASTGPGLIYTKSMVMAAFSHCYGETNALTERDVDVLLTHISRDLQQAAYDGSTGTVRFVPPDSSLGESAELEPISENEVAIARLKTLLLALEAEVTALETKTATLDKSAREAVAEKRTTAARGALRSKKLVSGTLEKRRDTLLQLQEVYDKIEAAHSNAEIVRVMEASAGVLRSLNQQVGGADGVQSVADRLRDEMDTADEVNTVLGEAAGAGVVNEDEVDEEFEALERAAQQANEAAQKQEKERIEAEEAAKTKQRLEELDKPLPVAGKDNEAPLDKMEVDKETVAAS